MSRERLSPYEEVVVRGVIGLGKELLDQSRSHNASLGISLDRSISDKHLAMYIQWALDHCRHCPVLIDDWEFRHNYIVFNGMEEEQATDLALHKGVELATRVEGIVAAAKYPYREIDPSDHRGHGVWVNRSSSIFRNGLVANILDTLVETYKRDDEFRLDVDTQVERSVNKRLTSWSKQVTESVYQIGRVQLARFVLEETAITINYVERDYAVELYAGTPIQVVVNLYDPQTNKYPKLREALNLRGQYGHISLGIERTPQKQTSLG